ncbi:helix-turn-helix domain-containing protein [Rummeliibacillus stabekisii]|uniref:HTH cro/C1-type domain-containing protein n=1 Tax=Rummeliibacillus stabekisii TaxID=241244 RepID=A0A143HG31_9BACL|nr:helix-turn-helix transcriptional regulator [Rummeliibacillus stabekisii]AMX00446.1 hypothetical protein ATY39_14105 [Rummeliibacillus stabekisii]
MTNVKTLGEILKSLRGKRTQEDVSKELGLSRARYSHYENNRVEPDQEILKRLADYYKVTTDYLLGRTQNISTTELVLSNKDERDVAKTLDNVREQLERQLKGEKGTGYSDNAVSFHGEPMSDEAIESLLSAIEFAERTAKVINKKYTPNKYKKNNNDNTDV